MAERTISEATAETLRVLGQNIAAERRARRWKAADLAERAGISAPTLSKIERGEPGVAIGSVFEAAYLVGIPLLSADRSLDEVRASTTARLALVPQRSRDTARSVDDDF
ncbi:helix-turn-helix domain-containing protein [Microcella sp.]|uniref:helix-turn-helix domain-containing protein n=1 Tax=Microcella sp. TaxID=1913979 RepID=UPI002566DD58|nr:helix-turn-helix transcriptional regulator [Microcella sp.]MBX9472739.1 helix-turn-helix domain-containing protein [Microcella sp.]